MTFSKCDELIEPESVAKMIKSAIELVKVHLWKDNNIYPSDACYDQCLL